MIELQQLGLARQLAAKTMLELLQDPVLVVVVHDMSYHAMLEELAADAGQTNWPVVFCERLLALLVRGYHIRFAPIIRHDSGPVGPVKDVRQNRRDGSG